MCTEVSFVCVTLNFFLSQDQNDLTVMVTRSQNEVGEMCMMQVGCMYGVIEDKVFMIVVSSVVISLPRENVIRSVIEECAPDWYRLGIELGYKDCHIRAMTFDIPTPESKLQAIIERKSVKHGKENAVEALLDVCDQILPLATVTVLKNLGIEYSGTGRVLLYLISYMVQHSVYVLCTVL